MNKSSIIVIVLAVAAGLVAAYAINLSSVQSAPAAPPKTLTHDEQIPLLIKGLMEKKYEARKAAGKGLFEYTGVDFGYDPNQLEDERAAAAARYEAWWNRVRDKGVDERLFAALDFDNCTNRAGIAKELSNRKYTPVLEYARKNAAEKSLPPDVRIECIAALGKFKDKQSAQSLVEILKDGTDGEAAAAASALGEIAEKSAVQALMDSLKREHLGTRASAALAIAKISPENAEDAFLNLLYSKDVGSKAVALDGLAQFGTAKAVPLLFDELDGPLKSKARKALTHIAGVDLGEDKDAWKKHFEK